MATLTTNNSSRTTLFTLGAHAHWLLRLPVAATFLYHGVTKLPALEAGAAFMGLPLWLWLLVAIVEVLAGLGLVAGGFIRNTAGDIATRIGGISAIAIMIGAIYLVHWGQWSNLPSETHPAGGMEFQTLLLALGAYFTIRGNEA